MHKKNSIRVVDLFGYEKPMDRSAFTGYSSIEEQTDLFDMWLDTYYSTESELNEINERKSIFEDYISLYKVLEERMNKFDWETYNFYEIVLEINMEEYFRSKIHNESPREQIIKFFISFHSNEVNATIRLVLDNERGILFIEMVDYEGNNTKKLPSRSIFDILEVTRDFMTDWELYQLKHEKIKYDDYEERKN